MKRNIVAFALLLTSLMACGQKKIDTVTLSNGKTIVIYDNKTWAYTNTETKPETSGVTDAPKTTGTNTSGTNNYNGKAAVIAKQATHLSVEPAPKKAVPVNEKFLEEEGAGSINNIKTFLLVLLLTDGQTGKTLHKKRVFPISPVHKEL